MKTNKGEKICSIEDIENFFDIDRNLKKTRKSGDFFTNIPEPKNIMTFLGHRLERFMQYQRAVSSENGEGEDEKKKKIFDEDEYLLVKEMPLARSTFYDIKIRAKDMLSTYKDKKSFLDNFNKLLDAYDLEEKTKSEISEFYMKKYKPFFDESNKTKEKKDETEEDAKDLNSINIEKYTNDKNKLNNNSDFIYTEGQFNHNAKRIDYNTIKESFKNELENDGKI